VWDENPFDITTIESGAYRIPALLELMARISAKIRPDDEQVRIRRPSASGVLQEGIDGHASRLFRWRIEGEKSSYTG
jgi:hypothetical protein